MYEIELANQQTLLEVDEEFLIGVARHTLTAEQVQSAEISIALVDNATIWSLNRQFLNHDFPTDVISFSLDEPGEVESAAKPPAPAEIRRGAGRTLSGEVVVSAEMALQTALQYHWSPRDELILYLVHGLLHLCGYDDLTDQELPVMRLREREILQHWKLRPHYAEPDSDSGATGEMK